MRGVLLELRRLWAGDPAIPRNITIGRNVYIGRGVRFDWNFGHLVTVGDDCTIVGGTRIVCHDASSNRHLGVTWCAPVTLGRRVYIGADSLVMPGVTIGDDAVVAAGAVVTSDVAPGAVVAGVPARQITTTAELDGRRLDLLKARPCFGMTYHGRGLTLEQVRELRAAAAEGGYFLGSVERAKASAAPASSDESFGGSAAPDA